MDNIISTIKSLPDAGERPFIIAISGFGGSGKTTLANSLKTTLIDAQIVSIDSFSNHEWHRNDDWDNFDRNRFAKETLIPARNNDFPLVYRSIPWPGQAASIPTNVSRSKYLLVEGCSIFHPDLLQYYDYKIWVDCPLEIATERGMWRDRHINQDEQDYYWKNVWMPNEKDFMEKYHPNKHADITFDTSDVRIAK